MEIAKLAVAVLAGAIGGFAAAKLFGGKKAQDGHVVLKVWGAHTNKPCIEVPMRPVEGGWMGGTPCAEDAFTMTSIDKKEYDLIVEKLKKAYAEEKLIVPEVEADPVEEAEELETEVEAEVVEA